jgi:hypothetical protein
MSGFTTRGSVTFHMKTKSCTVCDTATERCVSGLCVTLQQNAVLVDCV